MQIAGLTKRMANNMQVEPTTLPDVFIIKPDVFSDFRGKYLSIHSEKDYDSLVPDVHFVEWDIATSRKGVFRGIHYSPHCWKIYQCLNGTIYYVFVNCDKNDPEFGRWASFHLEPFHQLVKHPKYGAGMLALEDNTILYYAQSQYYNPNDPDQETFTLRDFPEIFIPNMPLLLSKRDTIGEYEFRCYTKR